MISDLKGGKILTTTVHVTQSPASRSSHRLVTVHRRGWDRRRPLSLGKYMFSPAAEASLWHR
jgi:hypothetical protein